MSINLLAYEKHNGHQCSKAPLTSVHGMQMKSLIVLIHPLLMTPEGEIIALINIICIVRREGIIGESHEIVSVNAKFSRSNFSALKKTT